MSNINTAIGQNIIEQALREGFEIYAVAGQIRIRHVGQMTNQPSDGTPEGDKAKAQTEQYDGPIRQMSQALAAAVNNSRGSILLALGAHPIQMRKVPAEVKKGPVPNLPGYGDGEVGDTIPPPLAFPKLDGDAA